MNVLIDDLHNKIHLYSPAGPREKEFYFAIDFDYSLSDIEGQTKAFAELLKTEEAKRLVESRRNQLILPDHGLGFGSFDLPALSRFKMKDVFLTQFKLCYPNYNDFFVLEHEYSRGTSGAVYLYTFIRKDNVNPLLDMAKANKVHFDSLNSFSGAYAKTLNAKSSFPKLTLFLGSDESEIIITRGQTVLYVQNLGYGVKTLLDGNKFLDSAYQIRNQQGKKYAAFSAENFAKKIAFSDENIAKSDPNAGLSFTVPKELRIMKDEILANYKIKNNIRILYAWLADNIFFYAGAPYFLPLKEVSVYGDTETMRLLEASPKEGELFELQYQGEFDPILLLGKDFRGDPLFTTGVRKERRSFDWKKFLSMEIGKKKA